MYKRQDEYSIINNSTTSYTEHLNFDPLAKLTSSQVRAELASIEMCIRDSLDTIEGAKDQFSAEELKTLKTGAQQVKEIEMCIRDSD